MYLFLYSLKVGKAILAFVEEDRFENIPVDIGDALFEDFPFNFGIRIREKVNHSKAYFRCMANDKCRCRPTLLPLNVEEVKGQSRVVKIHYRSDVKIVEDHLREEHWNQLIQLNYSLPS